MAVTCSKAFPKIEKDTKRRQKTLAFCHVYEDRPNKKSLEFLLTSFNNIWPDPTITLIQLYPIQPHARRSRAASNAATAPELSIPIQDLDNRITKMTQMCLAFCHFDVLISLQSAHGLKLVWHRLTLTSLRCYLFSEAYFRLRAQQGWSHLSREHLSIAASHVNRFQISMQRFDIASRVKHLGEI